MSEHTIRYLVLDKSFLQGCTRNDLESVIRSGNRFIVTAEQYVEVCTSDRGRKPLLYKLHGLSDYIDLLDHIGTLYKYEIKNQRPCSPIRDRFIQGVLNPTFTFRFTDEQTKAIEGERDHLENKAADEFPQIVREITLKNRGLDQKDICRTDVIREVYGRLRAQESRLPPTELLNDNWALYRKVQVDLIATFDYLQSYDGTKLHISQRRRAHDQVDFRVCVVAALVGGLAARDKIMARYFQTICPAGHLVC